MMICFENYILLLLNYKHKHEYNFNGHTEIKCLDKENSKFAFIVDKIYKTKNRHINYSQSYFDFNQS